MDTRIRERRRRVRRHRQRRRLRRTVAVVVVLLLALGLVALERSPLVGLEEVRVTGVERLEPARVRETADLEPGTSTLRLPLGRAEQRVERLPAVRDATARRIDPLTVEIAVTERTPVAVVTGEGRAALIDEQGVIMARGSAAGVPVIRLPDAPVPEPGSRARADEGLQAAHTVLTGLSGPLQAEVVRYVAPAADELTLVLADGTRVRFGRPQEMAPKVRALSAVLEELGEESVAVIDVRAPSAPVVER